MSNTKHNDAKHTPGPWTVVGGDVKAFGPGLTGDSYAVVIADCHVDNSRQISAAEMGRNARLIAAAPDGLEFAEAFERWFQSATATDPDQGKRLYNLHCKAQAFLAKAKGEGK